MSKNFVSTDLIQLWRFTRIRLLFSIFSGIITFIIVAYFRTTPFFIDFVIGIIISFIVFLLFILKDAANIFNLNHRVEKAERVYREIIDAHNELPPNYSKLVDNLILDKDHKNGIILLNVYDRTYRKWLSDFSIAIKGSYCSTMANQYSSLKELLTYPTADEKKKGKLTPEDVITFLEDNNRLNCQKKKRIFVGDKSVFYNEVKHFTEAADSALSDLIIRFFKAQNKFDLIFLDKAEIQQFNNDLYSRFCVAMHSDYAVFDESLAITRIDSDKLSCFFVNNTFDTLPIVLKEFFSESTFEHITAGYYMLSKTMKLSKCKRPIDSCQLIEAIREDLKIQSV
jgi:MFS superfamily sulfate permease-like transporter